MLGLDRGENGELLSWGAELSFSRGSDLGRNRGGGCTLGLTDPPELCSANGEDVQWCGYRSCRLSVHKALGPIPNTTRNRVVRLVNISDG